MYVHDYYLDYPLHIYPASTSYTRSHMHAYNLLLLPYK